MTHAWDEAAPSCQGPDPTPRKPSFALPSGACDCHAHVFGRYPYRPARRYTPAAVGLNEYCQMLATLGLTRAVVVQPDIYQDNQATIDALVHSNGSWRGIARLQAGTDVAEIARLHGYGFRGVRLDGRGDGSGLRDIEAVADRIAPFGWHVQLHLFACDLPALSGRLSKLRVPIVLDHFARLDTTAGLQQDGFRALLDLVSGGRCWVKLSAPYRFADRVPPYASLTPFARALIATSPDRMLWGSDWPHSSHDGFMPNDGTLLDLLAEWAPDAADRQAILQTNPAKLYGFAEPPVIH